MRSRTLLLAIVALAVLCTSTIRGQSVADGVARVERLIAEKKPQEALDLAKSLVTQNPKSSDAWWAQARVRRELGDATGAVADYSKAIALDSRNARAYAGRAHAKILLDQWDEARRDADRALEINNRSADAYDIRARVKAHAGDTKGALEDCDRAIAADSAFVSALARRAALNSQLRNFEAVIRDATAALSRSPDLADTVEQRAYAFLELKRYREAIADYTHAIELRHAVANSYNARAFCHRELGELAEALADVRKAIVMIPNDVAANRNLREIQALLDAGTAAPAATTSGTNPTQGLRPPAPAQPQQQSAQATFPVVPFTAGDPCSSGNSVTAGTPWQKAASLGASTTPAPDSVTLRAAIDVQSLSRAQYGGAVSTAYEGMRLLYGPMSNEDTKRFEKIWSPLFDYQSQAIVAYLDKLNPLLAQFLAGREAMMRAAAAYDAAVLDASLAVAAKERAGWEDAMAAASGQAAVMRSLQGGLADLARRIEALGNPPSPLEAKCNARGRHQQALDTLDALAEESAPTGEVFSSNSVTISLSGGDTFFAPMTGGVPKEGIPLIWDGRSFYAEIREIVPKPDAQYTAQDQRDSGNGHLPLIEKAIVWIRGTLSADGTRVERLEGQDERNQAAYLHVHVADVPFDPAEFKAARAVPITAGPWSHEVPYTLRFPKGYEAPVVAYSGPFAQNFNNIPVERRGWLKVGFALNRNVPAAVHGSLPASGGAPATAAAEKAKADAAAAEVAAEQERRETVAFHQANITFLTRTLQSEQAELARETNDGRRRSLSFLVIQLQSDIQGEQDLIASSQTGAIVHTRSVFDEFAQQQFIQGIRQEAVNVDGTRRIASAVDRQVEILPEPQRSAMREKVRNLLDGKTLASGDVDKARRVANAISNEVQGYWQGQAAMEEEKALAAQEHEFYVQLAVMATGGATVGVGSAAFAETFGETAALTVWGPHLIGGVYGGVTGTIAGGPAEGLTQTVAWSSSLGYMATQFLEGYQSAASDPKSDGLARLWAGVQQAGTAYILGEAFNFGTGLVHEGALSFFGTDSQLFKPIISGAPTLRQQFDAGRTQQQIDDARTLIALYQKKELELATLRTRTPATAPEVRQLDGELQNLAASINSAYHTKWLMKYEAHPLVRTKFDARVGRSYDDAMPEIIQILKDQKYDMQGIEFVPMRNASSAGSSSMDLDLALKERPGMVFMRDGQQVSLHEFMTDAQKALNRAYHDVTGFSAKRSDLLLTTSLHPEAFTDVRLLKRNVDFESIDPQDIANIGSVIQVKAAKIEGDPIFSSIGKAQATCRESVKEIDNMLLPALRQRLAKAPSAVEKAKLQASLDHWETIQKVFKQIGTQEANPYEILRLERTLREQTGGLGIHETVGELTRKFEKLGTSATGK